jgi:uroporphyrinogen-III decarboxylase
MAAGGRSLHRSVARGLICAMTGRQRIEAALSPAGSPEIPAVICYEGVYVRDHWKELTALPWWHAEAPDVDLQLRWRAEVLPKIGQDWFDLPSCRPRRERDRLSIVERPGGVFVRDAATSVEEGLVDPGVGGWASHVGVETTRPADPPVSRADLDRRVPDPDPRGAAEIRAAGEADLADRLLAGSAAERFPVVHVDSPFWHCYKLWGFEDLMVAVASEPDLVRYACARILARDVAEVRHAAARGARAIWIEECLADTIDPEAWSRISVPVVRSLVDEIHARGMSAVYYFCGDPNDRWDRILSLGADALSLEESKKGFTIDIEDVVVRVNSRMCVLGNLDAFGVLERGSDADLEHEVRRQVRAGRRNGGRFIMSTGSPVTPETPPERVRRYLEIAREAGRSSWGTATSQPR